MSRDWSNSVVADTSVVTTAETIAITTEPFSQGVDGEPVTVSVRLNMTAGTGTTNVVVRLRRGTLVTSPQIGEDVTFTLTAAQRDTLVASFTTQPASSARQQFVATVQQTGATGNGTVHTASSTVSLGMP